MEKLVYQPYRSETYPINNIVYVKDTNENRKILTEKMGKQYLDGFMNDYSYIKIDTNKNTWTSSFSFEWLYRNSPPLTDIYEFIK